MGEQESEETLKALKIEQKMLEERLKNIAIKMRLIILKDFIRNLLFESLKILKWTVYFKFYKIMKIIKISSFNRIK